MNEYQNIRTEKGESLLLSQDNYVVIDIETTGLSFEKCEIIEIAAIKIENNIIIDEFQSLIQPNNPVDDFITNLTGISNDMLKTAPDIKTVINLFYDFVGASVLVGHNVNFDINFLYDACIKNLNKPLTNNYIDTMRLSRKYINDVENYKLQTLSKYFNISYDGAHRALKDCYITNNVYLELKKNQTQNIDKLVENLDLSSTIFKGKKVCIKGKFKVYDNESVFEIIKKCEGFPTEIFYQNCDYIIFSQFTYDKMKREIGTEMLSGNAYKALELEKQGTLKILSEFELYDTLNISYSKPLNEAKNLKDITTDKTEFDETHPLYNKVCVFTGTLDKMLRNEAMQKVVDLGGILGSGVTRKTNYLIMGCNDYNPLVKDGKSTKQKKAEDLLLKGNDIQIISEEVFYSMLEDN